MAATGLEVWDKSVQIANIWLDEIMDGAGPDRQAAWHAPGAQTPLLVRGAYFEQWHLAAHSRPVRNFDGFLDVVGGHLGQAGMDPATITAAVFHTLARHVGRGQMAKVFSVRPAGMRTALGAAETG